MPSPRISVVIPTLNEEKFIGLCLESLVRQTVRPFEIIVVDAGSTDRTVEVARRYTDKVFQSPVANIAYQRELGVSYARGEYILLADGDTVLPEDAIKLMLENFRDPSVVAVTVDIAPLNPNPITWLNCWARNLVTPWLTQRGCYFMFRREMVETDDLFSVDGYVSKMDIFPLMSRLKGRVVKDSRVVVLTDIPFEQQVQTAALLGLTVVGAVLTYLYVSGKITF
jgi:glycosyltransferase involved in cell wall biosynthesis